MLNSLQLNTSVLNALSAPSGAAALSYDQIQFNGYSLQTTDRISSRVLFDSMPTRDIRAFRAPLADGGDVIGDNFGIRQVSVQGILKADTAAELETAIDTFKRNMAESEGELLITMVSDTRRCYATLVNSDKIFDGRDHYHITFVPYKLIFRSYDPYWTDLSYTSESFLGQVILSQNIEIENTGAYTARGVAIITINSETDLTVINLSSNTNQDEMEITPSGGFTAGDILKIDGENKSVTLNGTEIDYNGVFLDFDYGTNSIALDFTATAADYDITLKYKKTYL